MFNMKLTALILTLGFLTSCKESAKVVLLVGDSWASFVCAHKSLNQALHKAGILDAEANQECAEAKLKTGWMKSFTRLPAFASKTNPSKQSTSVWEAMTFSVTGIAR